jgi:hypothetical protein
MKDMADLTRDLGDMGLPPRIENSLTLKLENAFKSLERGGEKAAINKLGALIHEVDALSAAMRAALQMASKIRCAAMDEIRYDLALFGPKGI